jgi:hypothetical protein
MECKVVVATTRIAQGNKQGIALLPAVRLEVFRLDLARHLRIIVLLPLKEGEWLCV